MLHVLLFIELDRTLSDLTQQQADKLWDCLTTITGATGLNREELYNWLLSQLKNRDGGHALSLETFKHLLIEKVRSAERRNYFRF